MSDARQELATRLASMPGVGRVSIELDNGTTEECGVNATIAEMEALGLGCSALIQSARSELMRGDDKAADTLLMLADRMARAVYESEPD